MWNAWDDRTACFPLVVDELLCNHRELNPFFTFIWSSPSFISIVSFLLNFPRSFSMVRPPLLEGSSGWSVLRVQGAKPAPAPLISHGSLAPLTNRLGAPLSREHLRAALGFSYYLVHHHLITSLYFLPQSCLTSWRPWVVGGLSQPTCILGFKGISYYLLCDKCCPWGFGFGIYWLYFYFLTFKNCVKIYIT